jgi:hypothetical protein
MRGRESAVSGAVVVVGLVAGAERRRLIAAMGVVASAGRMVVAGAGRMVRCMQKHHERKQKPLQSNQRMKIEIDRVSKSEGEKSIYKSRTDERGNKGRGG